MAPEHRLTTGRSLVLSLICLQLYVTPQANTECDQTFVSRGAGGGSAAGAAREGTFHAPRLHNPLGHTTQCLYTFVAGPGQRVDLSFTAFNLRGTPPECNHEFMDVYAEVVGSGGGGAQQLIDSPWGGRYCGPIPPRRRVSLRRVLTLAFSTDKNSTSPDLFAGRYAFINDTEFEVGTPVSGTPCSFTVMATRHRNGSLLSPTYPGVYPKDLTCNYQFIGESGQRIRLEFRDFDLFFGGPHCPFDYVKVYDGLDNSSAVIGTYCGQQRNLVLYSSEATLLVTFSTLARTANTQNRGFKGIFEFSNSFVKLDFIMKNEGEHIKGSECDQKILSRGGSSGFVVSPNYPYLYFPKTVCRYFIYGMQDAQHLERVRLHFQKFAIPKGEKEDCTDGYLKIYLKGQEATDSYDKFDVEACGDDKALGVLVSDGPRLVLVFSSGELQGRGFKANYTFETEYRIPGTAAPDGSCSFTYRSVSRKRGEFNSPRYPSNYPSATNCTYNFYSTPNEQVVIVFDNFKVRADNANATAGSYGEVICQEDWLEMYNMYRDGSEKLIGRFCGMTAPGPVESNTGAIGLKVFLHADAEGVYSGFRARYNFETAKSIFGDCGGNITNLDAGIISSPNFPENYDGPGKGLSSKTCNWYIYVRPKKKILLNFERFAVEGDPAERGCPAAVLRLWYTSDGTPIERCGVKLDSDKWQYITDTNTLRITFTTADKSVGAQGWRAVWTEVSSGPSCLTGEQFQCLHSGYCIAQSLRCDRVNNCGHDDNSDEEGCYVEPLPTDYSKVYQVLAIGILFITAIVFVCCYRRRRARRLATGEAQALGISRHHSTLGSLGGLPVPPSALPTQIPPPPGQAHKDMYPVSPVAGPSGGTRPPSIRFSHVCATEQLDASATERYVNDDSV